ncbi:MAG: hypothetical protein EXS00_00695 [Phycisphaerales bacterium]|nr:hypothetical protein [Phycisphaerales bacterium]
MSQAKRSVVVTGIGPVCGFGVGAKLFWDGLTSGATCIAPVVRFDASEFPCSVAAFITDEQLDILTQVPRSYRKATKVMARDIEIAVAAAAAAVASAGLTTRGTAEGQPPTISPDRVGAHIGAGLIAAEINELTAAFVTSRHEDGTFDYGQWGTSGMQNLTPLWLLKYLPNMLACHVTIIHDCQGPSNTITCGEVSAALSIGESMRAIQRGAADACLSGGAESKINPMGLLRQHFAKRTALVPAGSDGTEVVRPFTRDAPGTVLGEGGGILVLEAAETARARGAVPLARVAGFAAGHCACADTLGIDLSAAGGDVAAVLRAALADAQISPDEIDVIVPLGAAIPSSDSAEREAILEVFGARAATIPLITLVPAIGNCGAGASALAAIAAVLCLHSQTIPARRNGDGATDLDAGAAPSRSGSFKYCAVLSLSLGGQVAAIVLGRDS